MAKKKKQTQQNTQGTAAHEGAASAKMAGTACRSCQGRLVDLEDYTFHQRLRRAAACVPASAVFCIAWSVIYVLVRLIVGGKLGAAGAGGLALLLGQKIVVGAVLGAVLGVLAGILRTDAGMFLGVVAGSIGGFFVAHAPAMPLLSDAAHRPDIVAAAMIGGVMSGATVVLAHNWACRRFDTYIGPEPHGPSESST